MQDRMDDKAGIAVNGNIDIYDSSQFRTVAELDGPEQIALYDYSPELGKQRVYSPNNPPPASGRICLYDSEGIDGPDLGLPAGLILNTRIPFDVSQYKWVRVGFYFNTSGAMDAVPGVVLSNWVKVSNSDDTVVTLNYGCPRAGIEATSAAVAQFKATFHASNEMQFHQRTAFDVTTTGTFTRTDRIANVANSRLVRIDVTNDIP